MSNDKGQHDSEHDRPDIAEDVLFQERTWAVQRIGWWAMGLLIVLALAGLFAAGPLSSTQTQDPTGALRAEYQRFLRLQAPSTLVLHVSPQPASGGTLSIRINR